MRMSEKCCNNSIINNNKPNNNNSDNPLTSRRTDGGKICLMWPEFIREVDFSLKIAR